jgi:hypothetical protein
MSNITGRPASVGTPALAAGRPWLKGAARLPKRQFLFDTNRPFFRIPNLALPTKPSTSIFLFDTNEKHPSTSHLSPIANHGDSQWPKN